MFSRFSRLGGIALAGASAILAASSSLADGPATRPIVIAHRGGALLMPENTFPAFDNAVRLGADMLEFDMQMTADNQLIITHDGTVNATFCTADPGSGVAPGPVRSLTLAELLQFDCGSQHRALYPTQKAVPGTHMPTPDSFFARYKHSRALFYGETKMPGPGQGDVDPVAITRLVEAAVRRYGLEDRFILQSADYRTIDAMHEINPRIRTCLLSPWRFSTDYLALAREHHATCILLRVKDTNAVQVQQLRDAGILVFSDVVDDEAGWRAYRALGMSAIFTNDPAGLIAFLSRDRGGKSGISDHVGGDRDHLSHFHPTGGSN
jgi:glycerophosphoryl diester phosphodiesterase